jgi:hypothetical protein
MALYRRDAPEDLVAMVRCRSILLLVCRLSILLARREPTTAAIRNVWAPTGHATAEANPTIKTFAQWKITTMRRDKSLMDE